MASILKAEIKSDWLKIVNDTTKDDLIDRLIAACDKQVERWCNQPLTATTITSYFNGHSGYEHNTGYTVPVTLTTLKYRDLPTDAWTAATGTTAVFEQHGTQFIYHDDGFTSKYWQLIMSVGYATVPEDVKICVAEMVKELYLSTPFANEGDRFGVSAMSDTDGAFSKAILDMKSRVYPKLFPYRRITI